MPWARLHDQANGSAKILALSNGAHRLWSSGLIYAQFNLTNGFIPVDQIATFGVRSNTRRQGRFAPATSTELQSFIAELCASLVPGKGPLWHPAKDEAGRDGYLIHDFFDWNERREVVLAQREAKALRVALTKDPDLRERIRRRDGDSCRYCRQRVNWKDRKSDHGGTYDCVRPGQGVLEANIVVCCRSCQIAKGWRTPEDAGLILQPVLDLFSTGSRPHQASDLDLVQRSTTTTTEIPPERSPAGSPAAARAMTRRVDAEGRTLAGGVAWAPGRATRHSAISHSPRCQSQHLPCTWAACARGICVPPHVAGEWLRQLDPTHEAPRSAEAEVRAFVEGAVAALPASGSIGMDPLKFWRQQWEATHAPAATASAPKRATHTPIDPNAYAGVMEGD